MTLKKITKRLSPQEAVDYAWFLERAQISVDGYAIEIKDDIVWVKEPKLSKDAITHATGYTYEQFAKWLWNHRKAINEIIDGV